ncbi:protein BCAP isoform X2 [Pelodiscus sinensis]|uniref:protein BCAP isoform X2 n=1 Tax=Pelodiscus sinensis TaxID=13735 RepID=UPI0003C450C0|nr:outer dense fiber protein 2-like isoform X1 [Pelodiscus sinensis]XP_006120318.1 outer dense fiber protein 2-like isoform X1 [Pelodiscus sinensis]XP_006120319.1 outer dense fiber protein 2-like isoform X1 [Pelodiscus sinensis]XP_025038958.1 outer dense fiber protein 2-like isoform X1 [Pelodiscus sinensis]|eukprot:XP_006120317.1 outer dense fiber protein 2-like isoform X1 [Pelodiscus sinensis]
MEEDPRKQNWSSCMKVMDKHQTELNKLSPQLKSRSQKNFLQQNLCESEMRRLKEDALNENVTFQEKLLEAQMAVNSTEMFLPLFKVTIAAMTNVCNLPTSDIIKISKQEDLLIKELETLKHVKELLLHLLRTTEHKEISSKHIDVLMHKLTESENENDGLRKEMLITERRIVELSSRLQLEKANALKADHLSKSVGAVHSHLQCQIQKKEAENDQLKAKIQTLEKKIIEWKLQIGENKHQILAVKETNEQRKKALKKATRAQKQRAEHFEASVENLTSKIRKREVKLSEVLSASSVWKNHYEKAVEEKTRLEVQTETLKEQITKLLEDLKKIQDHGRNSNEEICGKLTSISSEKANIHLENAKLKALLTALEDNTVATEAELLDLQEEVKQQENLAEQYKTEVQKLQTEAEELKTRYEKVLNENKLITEAKDLEISEVRSQMQAHLKELEHVRDLQKAAEERLQEYQENMLSYRRSYADKSKTIRELQVQIDNNNRFLRKNSLEDEKYNIEKKYEYLKRQLEKMDVQNQELAHQLANQEESLQHTELQLKEKLAEYDALARQLEAALEEGRKKESEEVEKMSSKERALQTKILALETELRERREERKRLVSKLNNSEKQQQVCLKELEHNLQKSENQTHSIQNYVQFLKNSYVTMFG